MNDAMGVIMTGERGLYELTEHRDISALPVAGRYRLIDFIMSAMTNSGIINVGVATKSNYSSLMDHLGSGRAWDLHRGNYGLFVLPPFLSGNINPFGSGDVDMLYGIMTYFRRSRQKYVVLSGSHRICNITFNDAIKQHIESGADITAIYCKEEDETAENMERHTVFELSENRVLGIEVFPKKAKSNNASMDMYVMEKELLMSLIEECVSKGEHSLVKDAFIKNIDKLKIYAWEFNGYVGLVDSVASYFSCNMDILNQKIREELFSGENLIYTKIKNSVPTKYGENAHFTNCFIADGCTISGEAENSIIFRGVNIGSNTLIKNSIIMEGANIGYGCDLDNVILDKECIIRDGGRLVGQESYPVIIRKRAIV